MTATARVVVFVDYQNVHGTARTLFHGPGAGVTAGQIDPLTLGEVLVRRRSTPSRLIQVRVYRGRPHPDREPRSHRAHMRQLSAQTARGGHLVEFIERPLKYPHKGSHERPREKGIDVALAVDVVAMGLRGEYDVAVVVSTDSDLAPALERVASLRGDPFPRCEVAAWTVAGVWSPRLSASGWNLWCHWLTEEDYRSVHDSTDYAR
jgi:hypothetical protein